ncbi:hypothetical protein B0H66DRAFT_536472 [Apodospora peruviana]|uniref:Uncharacterized protein n=1 Tax=Apodospora peruviana TaxID=516989 RepID=A0AAE0HZ52_9PEZI|nr:hypothetical protein B0H66DRAFT_536472 [Apodospora peruviana]
MAACLPKMEACRRDYWDHYWDSENFGQVVSVSNASFDAYCRLMNNFGVALSTRAQKDFGWEDGSSPSNLSATALRDLDEAIKLAREHKSLLEGRGEPSDAVVLNLGLRLSVGGSKTDTYVTDHPEAFQLLRTRNLETLDAALHSMEEAVKRILELAEMFGPYHNVVKPAYLDRHKHTSDIKNLAKTLKISYLVTHMTLLRQFALVTTSISWLDGFEYRASKQLDNISCPFPNKHKYRRLYSDVILKRNFSSKKFDDLSKATFSVYEALHDESGHTVLNGTKVTS